MSDHKHLIIHYPSRILGGAELLFMHVALYAQARGYRVSYVDYVDGYVRKELGDKIEYIDYEFGKTHLSSGSIMLTPISKFLDLKEEFASINHDLSIHFWSVHPQNILHVLPVAKYLATYDLPVIQDFFRKDLSEMSSAIRFLVKNLHEAGSIHFMDLSNFDYNKQIFDLGIDEPSYVPVFVPCADTMVRAKVKNGKSLSVCWIGRLSTDKITAVFNLFDQLVNASVALELEFHIIGDGEAREQLESYCKGKLNVKFLGTLNAAALDKYLLENVDLVAAMGTSVLEGAKRRIPSIILNIDLDKDTSIEYCWLDESIGYSLGFVGGADPLIRAKQRPLLELLLIISNVEHYEIIGQRCLDYYRSCHSEEVSMELLFSKIERNSLNLGQWFSLIESCGLWMPSWIKKNILKYKINSL